MILRSPHQKYFFPCRASTLNTRGRKGVAWFASCLDCLKALKGMYKVLGERGEREVGTVALHRVICGVAKLNSSSEASLFNKCQCLCRLIHYILHCTGRKIMVCIISIMSSSNFLESSINNDNPQGISFVTRPWPASRSMRRLISWHGVSDVLWLT